MQIGLRHAAAWDWMQYLGAILVLAGPIIAVASVVRSRRMLTIGITIVTLVPVITLILQLYFLAHDPS